MQKNSNAPSRPHQTATRTDVRSSPHIAIIMAKYWLSSAVSSKSAPAAKNAAYSRKGTAMIENHSRGPVRTQSAVSNSCRET